MTPAAVAGQVLALTPIGGLLLSTLIFGSAVAGDVVLSIVLIVAEIILGIRDLRLPREPVAQLFAGVAAVAATGPALT